MATLRGLLTLALLAVPQVQGPPTFAVGVENVNVDVLVTRGGRTVEGLSARDFVLTDSGVPQRVEVVAQSGTAVDAVLVLDVSSSVQGERLAALRQARRRSRMPPTPPSCSRALDALERALSLGETRSLTAWVEYHLGRGRVFRGYLEALRARVIPSSSRQR